MGGSREETYKHGIGFDQQTCGFEAAFEYPKFSKWRFNLQKQRDLISP
jgi:hypothetical protein